ncbi:hypothetical protein D3C87_1035910 [compost metagenome]
MADEVPPVETIPFDPLFDTLIRLKCPGINQRNTFREEGAIIHCNNGAVFQKITLITKNWNRCFKVPSVATSQPVKRTCNSIRGFQLPGNLIRINSYSCKTPMLHDVNTAVLKRSGRCSINSTEAAKDLFLQTCRMNGKTPAVAQFPAKRVCRRKYSAGDIATMTKFRRLCGTYPLMSFDAKWACKVIVLTEIEIEVIRLISNLGRCKVPAILDMSDALSQRICIRLNKTLNVPDTNGTVMPRARAWTCKLYPAFEQNFSGKKICGTIKVIPFADFKYKGTEARFSCKVYPTMNLQGRRWRCGTIMLTQVDTRMFGRIWGGRPETNFFIRQDGRMIGKFR